MRGKIVVKGDFGPIEQKYQRGEISLQERDRLFTESRKGDGTIVFGGSDIGPLMGLSKYISPEYLVKNKIDPAKYPRPKTAQQKELFDNGHIFESAVAQKCASMLSAERNVEVCYEPCDLQFGNTSWPNIVANIDGFFRIGTKRYPIEVKTAALGGDAWKSFKDGKIPEDYKAQAATYATILGSEGVFFCVWNKESLEEKNFRVLWFPCPKDHDKVLDKVQRIAEDAQKGIVPDDKMLTIPRSVKAEAAERQYSNLNPEREPVKASDDLLGVFKKLEELSAEKISKKAALDVIERPFKDIKNKADREMKANSKDLAKELADLDKEMTEIASVSILPLIEDGRSCFIEDGEDTLEVFVERTLSFDKDAKLWLKENYPEVWEGLNAFKPKFSYSVKRQPKD